MLLIKAAWWCPRAAVGMIMRERAGPDKELQVEGCRDASECATEREAARQRLRGIAAEPEASSAGATVNVRA
jgi:hypothetical protein